MKLQKRKRQDRNRDRKVITGSLSLRGWEMRLWGWQLNSRVSFILLCQVSDAAGGIFSCSMPTLNFSMWELVP